MSTTTKTTTKTRPTRRGSTLDETTTSESTKAEEEECIELQKPRHAWNIDRSANAKLPPGFKSWIGYATRYTGARSECSYDRCNEKPQVGGHVWLSRKGGKPGGPVIAPICKSCNYCKKKSRYQDGMSDLRPGTYVKAEYTQEMREATRRFNSAGNGAPRRQYARNDADARHDADVLADDMSKLSLRRVTKKAAKRETL
jgi:hypothetical protein